jgi:hypothetical protein
VHIHHVGQCIFLAVVSMAGSVRTKSLQLSLPPRPNPIVLAIGNVKSPERETDHQPRVNIKAAKSFIHVLNLLSSTS